MSKLSEARMRATVNFSERDLSRLSPVQLRALMRGIGEVVSADRKKIQDAANFLKNSRADMVIECGSAVDKAIKILER